MEAERKKWDSVEVYRWAWIYLNEGNHFLMRQEMWREKDRIRCLGLMRKPMSECGLLRYRLYKDVNVCCLLGRHWGRKNHDRRQRGCKRTFCSDLTEGWSLIPQGDPRVKHEKKQSWPIQYRSLGIYYICGQSPVKNWPSKRNVYFLALHTTWCSWMGSVK